LLENMPTGRFIDVSVTRTWDWDWSGPTACTVGDAGELLCWHTLGEYGGSWVDSGWSHVSHSDSLTCAIRDDDSLACRESTGDWYELGASFAQVDVDEYYGTWCATQTDGTLHCGWIDGRLRWSTTMSGGPFSSPSVNDHLACAVDAAGTAQCWELFGDEVATHTNRPQRAPAARAVPLSWKGVLTLDAKGFVSSAISHPIAERGGRYEMIDVIGMAACGITIHGEIECFDELGPRPDLEPPSESP